MIKLNQRLELLFEIIGISLKIQMHHNMGKVKFKPRSSLGKYSLGIIILSPLLFYVSLMLIKEPLILGGTIYGGAFICGILGIVWKKDYSVLVFLSTLLGLLILLFVLQQELFPGLINLT